MYLFLFVPFFYTALTTIIIGMGWGIFIGIGTVTLIGIIYGTFTGTGYGIKEELLSELLLLQSGEELSWGEIETDTGVEEGWFYFNYYPFWL